MRSRSVAGVLPLYLGTLGRATICVRASTCAAAFRAPLSRMRSHGPPFLGSRAVPLELTATPGIADARSPADDISEFRQESRAVALGWLLRFPSALQPGGGRRDGA